MQYGKLMQYNKLMHFRKLPIACLAFAILAAAALPALFAADSPDAVRVRGSATQPNTFTVDQLRARFSADIKPVQFTSRGEAHTASGVPLLAILKDAGVRVSLQAPPGTDLKIKNAPLRMVVIVRGRDDYSSAISLAELLPEIGNKPAWLALDMDGKPIPAADGPVRLIVPGDAAPGRWVKQVVSIEILDTASAATQPVIGARMP